LLRELYKTIDTVNFELDYIAYYELV